MPKAVIVACDGHSRHARGHYLFGPKHREPLITRYALGLFAFEQGLNIEKAHDLLGWRPQVPFSEGLRRTFAT
jgi:nucleoside-diphosphate-sugar epimerase